MVRVLHIDDDKTWRDLVQGLDFGPGIEVHSVLNWETFKDRLDEQEFDVLLFDGSIERDDDGWRQAATAQERGHRVAVLSGGQQKHAGVKYFDKGKFCREALVAFVRGE